VIHSGLWLVSWGQFIFGTPLPGKQDDMGKNVCYDDQTGHPCVFASDERFEEIKQLTQNPEYICLNRGKVADSEANLRNPMPLKKRE